MPVFAVIGLGYFCAWTRVFSARAADGLSDYVFVVAIPLMIIRTFIEAKLPEGSPWGYWIAYFLGVAVVWAVGQTISAYLFHRRLREAVIHGFASSQSNVVLLGIPLVLSAYGEAGAVPLFLLIAVHLPLMMIAATVMIEGGEAGLSAPALKRFGWNMATNPILIGFFIGMLARYADVSLGGVPKTVIDMIAASAVPCALFALGLALHRYGIAGDLTLSVVISALKLMLLPLVVWLLVALRLPALAGLCRRRRHLCRHAVRGELLSPGGTLQIGRRRHGERGVDFVGGLVVHRRLLALGARHRAELKPDRAAHVGGRPAGGAQVAQRRRLVALGELPSFPIEHEPMMVIDRRSQAEDLLQ